MNNGDARSLEIAAARIKLALLEQSDALDLSGLDLLRLPEEIGQLTQLKSLRVSHNRLTTLPKTLGRLVQLQSLDAAQNQLAVLPNTLGQLTHLQSLHLPHNRLTSLPETLDQLLELRILDARDNQLVCLPESLRRLASLQYLFLHDNPALDLPAEVLGPRPDEVSDEGEAPSQPATVLEFYFRTRQKRLPSRRHRNEKVKPSEQSGVLQKKDGNKQRKQGVTRSKCKLLFFAANPCRTTQLALDEECREIDQKIHASAGRDSLEPIVKWAVRPDDLLQYLNQHRPHIVHFSGHGSATEEIILLDANRQPKAVSKAALKMLFSTLKDNIRIVVLNACFSRPQAEAITEVIDCAIGMKRAIGDKAAITFAAAFYRAIGFGRSVQEAFDQGKAALMLEGIAEEDTPELLVKTGVDSKVIHLIESVDSPHLR